LTIDGHLQSHNVYSTKLVSLLISLLIDFSSDLVLGLYFIIVPGNLFQSQNAPKVNALYEHVPEGPTWIGYLP